MIAKVQFLLMETKSHAVNQSFRPPSAGASSIVTERDHGNLPEELLTVLLHDLRSPLGAIGVLADLISSVAQDGNPADPRQLGLLQEAVTKAQRVLDDAVEIQSYIRGSSTFTPAMIEVGSIVKASLEKASHAPYFRNIEVEYDVNGTGEQLINVDVEKAETALLFAFEHVVSGPERPSVVNVRHAVENPYVSVHVAYSKPHRSVETGAVQYRPTCSLRGRLGTRRLGESRYNLQVCKKVMNLMGGDIEAHHNEAERSLTLRFPGAIR
jgi:K+-sensing histidine kinase KdpD